MDIRKGDKVVVIAGDDLGAEGEIHSVVRAKWGKGRRSGELKPQSDRVIVAGVNLVKKHQRRTGDVRTQFGIIEREAPLHVSNVMLVCPRCSKPTRLTHKEHADGSRSRICKQCGESVDE